MDEFYSPRNEALNLLIDIARLRGKNHLKPFMDYVAQILVTYVFTLDLPLTQLY